MREATTDSVFLSHVSLRANVDKSIRLQAAHAQTHRPEPASPATTPPPSHALAKTCFSCHER